MLGSLVRMASASAQVILSTQPPLLLDQVEPSDVIVAERVGMATELRRLDPEPLEAWLTMAGPRLLVHVEGQTEETFVNELLRPAPGSLAQASLARGHRGAAL